MIQRKSRALIPPLVASIFLLAGCGGLSSYLQDNPSTTSDQTSESSNEIESQDTEELAYLDSNIAENFLRDSFYENTGILTVVECPDSMSGSEGDSFTCYACPQDYVAVEIGGGYFYGDGTTEFRCDAAYEGFAVDYRVIDGQILLDNATTRGANQ